MSTLATNAITDASGGNTTTINGYTPTMSNMAGRNRIINGDMRINQRATTATTGYSLDRWYLGSNIGSYTLAQSTDAPLGFKNSLVVTTTSAVTASGTDYAAVSQIIEGNNIVDFGFGTSNAKTITVSFWVKSSLAGDFSFAFLSGSNAGGAWRGYASSYTINEENTWEYKTITIVGDTASFEASFPTDNSAGIYVRWDLGCGPERENSSADTWTSGADYRVTGTNRLNATNGATLYLSGVQLEVGSVATPFEHRQYGQELALCQRYFQIFTGINFNSYATSSGLTVRQTVSLPVVMRSTPTPSTITAPPTSINLTSMTLAGQVSSTAISYGGDSAATGRTYLAGGVYHLHAEL